MPSEFLSSSDLEIHENRETFWKVGDILRDIPPQLHAIITAGQTRATGWAATELFHPPLSKVQVGDIYFISLDRFKAIQHMVYFTLQDQILVAMDGSAPGRPGWDEYSPLLPILRNLAVSVITGYPTLLGWADEVDSPANYSGPEG